MKLSVDLERDDTPDDDPQGPMLTADRRGVAFHPDRPTLTNRRSFQVMAAMFAVVAIIGVAMGKPISLVLLVGAAWAGWMAWRRRRPV